MSVRFKIESGYLPVGERRVHVSVHGAGGMGRGAKSRGQGAKSRGQGAGSQRSETGSSTDSTGSRQAGSGSSTLRQAQDLRGRVLMIPPFGEERKCAYRLMVEMAQELAEKGWSVMRLDLSGCGESSGDHRDMTLAYWLEDVEAALKVLAEMASGEGETMLIGARLGANLALMAAKNLDVNRLVLWEPLLSGESFLQEMIRRKQIKEMMGGGEASSFEEELAATWTEGRTVDFDGFEMGSELKAELDGLALETQLEASSVTRMLLCHVGGARSLTGPWAKLERFFDGEDRSILCVRQKPFWGALDYEEARSLKDETLEFME